MDSTTIQKIAEYVCEATVAISLFICGTIICLGYIKKGREAMQLNAAKEAEEKKQAYRAQRHGFEEQMAWADKMLAVIDKTRGTIDKENKVHETIAAQAWEEIKNIRNSK